MEILLWVLGLALLGWLIVEMGWVFVIGLGGLIGGAALWVGINTMFDDNDDLGCLLTILAAAVIVVVLVCGAYYVEYGALPTRLW